jgi:hypothetical protein
MLPTKEVLRNDSIALSSGYIYGLNNFRNSVINQIHKNLEILSKRYQKDKRIQFFVFSKIQRWPYGGLNFLLGKAKGDCFAI